MPVRIYALAKQLNVDHKSIIEACKQAGITGKGSALASLSDEEQALIKSYLGGVPGGGAASRATATVARPSSRTTAAGRSGSGPQAALRREDYVAPTGTVPGKVPVLKKKPEKLQPPEGKPPEPEAVGTLPADQVEGQAKDEKAEPKKRAEKPERTGPAIKLAPLPKAQQPTPPPKPTEPAPQKPDIKLPADAIRASKAGSKPLSEHLRRQEEKRRKVTEKAAPRRPSAPGQAAETVTPSAPAKERGRRGARAPAKPEDGAFTLGGREQRQLRRKRVATARRQRSVGEEEPVTPREAKRLRRTGTASTAAPRKSNVVVELPCTVRSFSEALGLPAQQVLGRLLELGVVSNITAALHRDAAELLAEALGANVEFHRQLDLEEKLISAVEREDTPDTLRPRPPVVTFLGHVDHGKTSLLDRIIGTNVVSGEKGGITQHIRAYQVQKDGGAIAFVDTPGHEAFTAMRARGANCTDIAVLVVAADDGVMPQTEEAISHARAADVPVVVALNKMDLPGVNPTRALEELAANGLLPTEWGGDTEVIRTSAMTGEGIEELLETLLTMAELQEYQANPGRPASGICLEAEVQQGQGVVAKMLVEKGTLRVGDVLVCGAAHGRVKAMHETLDPYEACQQAGPSTPVNVTGLDVPPGAGDRFHVLESISDARQIAEERAARTRQKELSGAPVHVTLENLLERLGEHEEVRTLNIILRADVRGSIEAIRKELTKLEHPEVQVKVLQATVGGITEADVELANASDAVILGFNVAPDEGARTLADQYGVQIRRYDVIYQITEDLKAALEGMLKPERREVESGRALVQRVFHISRVGTVAGCRVLAGVIQRDGRARVIRDSRVIGDYPLDSLKREKDDAREVREGFECGIKLGGFDDVKEGDLLEVYRIEEIRRTF